jgi:transposase-like protein
MKCERCGSGMVKNGFNPSGSQKYVCRGCKRVTTPAPTPVGASRQARQLAINLVLDGSSFRSAARHAGVTHATVMAWFKQAADRVPDEPAKPTHTPEQIELDELFTFVGTLREKTKRSSSRPHGG